MAKVMILLFLTIVMITFLTFPTTEADYLSHICPNTTVFTPNSTFQSNLNNLLSTLSSSNSTTTTGFYNATAGRPPSETVYGHFLCRGDVNASTCKACVTTATSEVVQKCPVEKEVVIWYDDCMLRYSNKSFFSVPAESPILYMWNPYNVSSEPNRFNQVLGDTMWKVAEEAASDGDKFATREANAGFYSVYSLGQCTPDISSFYCNNCLRGAIARLPTCCEGKLGGRVLYPSCNVRFEIYPFYKIKTPPPSPAPAPPLSPPNSDKKGSSLIIVAIVVPVAIVLFLVGCFFLRRKARIQYDALQVQNGGSEISEITTLESLQFDFATIEAATNQFSVNNRLGEGGFGEVYKGTLPNGQEVAVKRLSKSSGQGFKEFKNEIVLVAKLQHRNLVRLLGFCSEGEEKILIYELVKNKSLDQFLFDSDNRVQLDWSSRYKIISGIARGILYLHQDSRLKIIHRDLKASNILLDGEMNPKIADFGLARIFGVDQTQENTRMIVGTYGYMPPEYAMLGQFSVKTDVYSLGVLILEIVTGEKNTSFYQSDRSEYLLTYAWNRWRDGTQEQLLDPNLRRSYSRNEVDRCIHIALLCVQEDPEKRPTMQTVVLMLSSYSVSMPLPQRPAFCLHNTEEMRVSSVTSKSSNQHNSNSACSVNEASNTELYPR